MTVENWSDDILLVELQDDPAFTDDLSAASDKVSKNPSLDVLVSFAGVNYLNSSNLAALLRLRKEVAINNERRLLLCSVNTHVWGLFLTTGLNKTFDFADEVSLGLASLNLERSSEQD